MPQKEQEDLALSRESELGMLARQKADSDSESMFMALMLTFLDNFVLASSSRVILRPASTGSLALKSYPVFGLPKNLRSSAIHS
ncbi:hypothetical protein E2C01_044768 [Portunus trituberculatus]|uniref:Uncharacterized protein n=1 Tax=Portunus trituberculatus TaxID=210409 RepID=A0A5B7G3A7_PORTR|nr:hypothetical protein [Portunus trituberculatus]